MADMASHTQNGITHEGNNKEWNSKTFNSFNSFSFLLILEPVLDSHRSVVNPMNAKHTGNFRLIVPAAAPATPAAAAVANSTEN